MAALTKSKTSLGVASMLMAISLGLALAPGIAEAKCQEKACCHKPNRWTNNCVKYSPTTAQKNGAGHLGHCIKWQMQCLPPLGNLQ